MNKLLEVTEKQILRGKILKICNITEPNGAAIELITAMLNKEGFKLDKKLTWEAVSYLNKKDLVYIETAENKVLGIRLDIVHISGAGIDVLEGSLIIEGVELS